MEKMTRGLTYSILSFQGLRLTNLTSKGRYDETFASEDGLILTSLFANLRCKSTRHDMNFKSLRNYNFDFLGALL